MISAWRSREGSFVRLRVSTPAGERPLSYRRSTNRRGRVVSKLPSSTLDRQESSLALRSAAIIVIGCVFGCVVLPSKECGVLDGLTFVSPECQEFFRTEFHPSSGKQRV